jgi:hypothetical protein
MKRARTLVLLVLVCSVAQASAGEPQATVASPDGRIVVVVTVDGTASYTVSRDAQPVIRKSQLGVLRDDADFTQGLRVVTRSAQPAPRIEKIEDRYDLPTIKRRHNVYRANRRVIELATAQGARMDVEVQVSNDGFAFR